MPRGKSHKQHKSHCEHPEAATVTVTGDPLYAIFDFELLDLNLSDPRPKQLARPTKKANEHTEQGQIRI